MVILKVINVMKFGDKIQFINDNVISCLKLLNYSPDKLFILIIF